MSRRTIGSLLVKLGLDAKEVDKGLKTMERNLKSFQRNAETVGRSMTIGFTAPFVLGIRQAIKAYDEEAQAVKRLEVALGRTSQALIDQASAIQKNTVYADDAILGIQAYAASLGHSEAETKKMTEAAVNLAAGLGIELDEAMKMLHKSTMGASKGLGQLVPGVKEMTKEQLKSGAAIDLVNDKFKGYAEQLAKTGSGPLKQFENQWGDLMEQFGQAAIPLMQKIVEKLKAMTDWFSKLSPSTKEALVNIGAIVALAGPMLLLSSSIIKSAQAMWGLVAASKALVTSGIGTVVGAIAAAYEGMMWFGENIGYGNRFGGGKGKLMKGYGESGNSSFVNQNLGLIPGMPAAQNSRFLAPPAGGGGGSGSDGDGGGTPQDIMNYSSAIARSLHWAASVLTPNRGNPAAGMASIAPNLNPAMAGSVGGGLTPLAGVGGHGQGIADMMNIKPNLEPIIAMEEQANSLKNTWIDVGNVFGAVMGSIIGNLEEGSKSFGEYALSAVAAIAKVIQAKMMELAINIVSGEAAKGGLPGALIGLAASTAVLALVSKLMQKQQAPKLATGGLAYGPTLATVGDNPNASIDPEVIAPLSKLNNMMRNNGSAAVQVMGVIRGNDIHLVTANEQGYKSRRGSGNLITF